MIKYIRGDIFKGKEDIIVHGCNCFKAMNSGIAKQVRALYPGAWKADYDFGEVGDENKLGDFTQWIGTHVYYPQRVKIINAYTQYRYGTDSIKCDYEAMANAFRKIRIGNPFHSIAMPKIGCGLAGGDWNIVSKIIEEVFGDRKITIYEYIE